jgi:hypothetical protein
LTEIEQALVRPDVPLVVVDVDEVLAMFMRGFGQFVAGHGYEMRITKFALFQNCYRLADGKELDLEKGRELFNAFFESDVEHIDPAPGASAALAALAENASVVILTNAPRHGREPRARWLANHGFPYPLVIIQLVADVRLRPLAPVDRERHVRIDDWPQLGPTIARTLGLPSR